MERGKEDDQGREGVVKFNEEREEKMEKRERCNTTTAEFCSLLASKLFSC